VLDLETGEAADWLRGASTRSVATGRFSPDGRWVAYLSDESERRELYLDRLPERGEKFRLSADGGSWPVCRRDGRELFYLSLTGDLMAVPIDMASDRNPIGTPVKLFSPRLREDFFDAAADGQRFPAGRSHRPRQPIDHPDPELGDDPESGLTAEDGRPHIARGTNTRIAPP
jgi:Tol biopolymer transport system component